MAFFVLVIYGPWPDGEKKSTYPSWSSVPTHPITTQIVHHTGEGGVATLGNRHVLQREHKVRFERVTRRRCWVRYSKLI